MKRNTTRFLTILLTAALLHSFAACGKSGENNPKQDVSTTLATETLPPETTVNIYGNVPDADYGGMSFSVLNQTLSWALCPLGSEGITGEILNDTVFQRNAALEDKLNIKLKVTDEKDGTAHNTAKNLILANDSMYDLNCLGVYRMAPMLSQHLFSDLTKLDDVHLDEPWYNQLTQPQYMLQGNLYMVHGNAQIEYFEGLWVLYFSKKLITDYKMTNPYDLVQSGKWTIDTFTEMVKSGARDLNADGVIDTNDVYGLSTHSGVTLSFLHGCDERAIAPDATGTPKVVVPDNRMVAVMEAIQKLMTDKSIRSISDAVKNQLFSTDQALFLGETLGSASKLREMVADFGIIPSPKFEESQEKYLSYMSPSGLVFCIPVSAKDITKSAVVLENLNALSYETVLPAYYDIVLGGKALRDEVSLRVLDMLLTNSECELAYVYQWNNYNSTVINLLSGTSPIASTLESAKTATEAAINAFINELKK